MKKIYLAAVAGNLGMLTVGQYFGWASPSLPILMEGKDETYPVRLTSEEASWVASLLMLGSMAGCINCTFIVNIIGRKNTMLLSAVPSIISWLMIAFATSSWELYISRFLAGLSTGLAHSATPMYIGEISPADLRGTLGSMFTVISKIGTTFEYVIGPFLSVRNLAFVSLVGPCLFLVIFIWLPESPYYLMRRNARQKAIKSLVQLRNKDDVYKEADDIEQTIKVDMANNSGFRELLCVPGNRRALITVISLITIHQMSGVQAVEQYAELIFKQANSNLEGKYLTMILGTVQVVCTIVCMFITDRSGRKSLLIISTIGSACSTAIVAIYFHLQYIYVDTSKLTWLPAIGVIMYVIMFSVGLSALPSAMVGELFPTNVKPLGTMVTIISAGVEAFGVTKLYLVIADNFGIHIPFWIFTACSLAGALFTLVYVPETKGKTLQQIQEKLHGSSSELYISRFLAGLSTGLAHSATLMYISEISPANIRGTLGAMFTVVSKTGTTFEYMIGPFLSVRNLAFVSLVGPCLFLVIFIWLPESPYYLMRNARQKAIKSLIQLRSKDDVYKEADDIEQTIKVDMANNSGFPELLCVPGNRRALITVMVLITIRQLSGVQAIEQYAELIFDHEANSKLEGKYLTIILGTIHVVCTIVCMFITDRSGRKSLLIISTIGSACSTAMVAMYFHLQHDYVDISKLTWLPAIGVIMYVIMFSLGLSALPSAMVGELFPMNVKLLGTTVTVISSSVEAFGVTKLYLVIADNFGVHIPFWIFTACSLAGAFFTLVYVPETKGKTLQQIQEKLHGLSNVEIKK